MSRDEASDWPVSWEASRRLRLETTLKATALERVEWLEEALRLAAATGALERRRRSEEKTDG